MIHEKRFSSFNIKEIIKILYSSNENRRGGCTCRSRKPLGEEDFWKTVKNGNLRYITIKSWNSGGLMIVG